jgi:hypothetical protein
MPSLAMKGEVALVTGGSSGIGHANGARLGPGRSPRGDREPTQADGGRGAPPRLSMKYAIPATLKRGGGAIVNNSSVDGGYLA